jgi:plasmid stabilization system protein ParE
MDLFAIGDYIARDSPDAARSWVERLRQRAAQAAEFPNKGRIVPEIGRSDVREVFLRNYRIVYRIVDHGVVVLTVFEGHKSLGDLDPDVEG